MSDTISRILDVLKAIQRERALGDDRSNKQVRVDVVKKIADERDVRPVGVLEPIVTQLKPDIGTVAALERAIDGWLNGRTDLRRALQKHAIDQIDDRTLAEFFKAEVVPGNGAAPADDALGAGELPEMIEDVERIAAPERGSAPEPVDEPEPVEAPAAAASGESDIDAMAAAAARAAEEAAEARARADAAAQAAAEARARADAARKAKTEAEAKAAAEAKAKADAEAERARIEAEQKAEAERARIEAERQAQAEAEAARRAQEEAAAEAARQAKAEADRQAAEAAQRQAAEAAQREAAEAAAVAEREAAAAEASAAARDTRRTVTLDGDVAAFFADERAVNDFLRAAVAAMRSARSRESDDA